MAETRTFGDDKGGPEHYVVDIEMVRKQAARLYEPVRAPLFDN